MIRSHRPWKGDGGGEQQRNMDPGGYARVLVLLDMSSTFDTVDHAILLEVLEKRFGVTGIILKWFCSYVNGRTQTFQVGS